MRYTIDTAKQAIEEGLEYFRKLQAQCHPKFKNEPMVISVDSIIEGEEDLAEADMHPLDRELFQHAWAELDLGLSVVIL